MSIAPADQSGPPKNPLDLGWAFSWDAGALRVVSDEALAKLNRPALSPSTAKAMTDCRARWAAERLLPTEEDPLAPAPIGTDAHSVFEDFYALPGYMRTRAELLRILEAHKAVKWPGSDRRTAALRTEWHARVFAALDGIWAIEDPKSVNVAGRETQLDGVEVNEVPFNGFADRIDHADVLHEDGSKTVKVVDYKTGKKRSEHVDQLRLYAAAYEAKYGVKVSGAAAFYTGTGVVQEASLSASAMAGTLRSFRKSWNLLQKAIETRTFDTAPSPLCGWCALVHSCPVARAEGKVDRTGDQGAPSEVLLGIPTVREYEYDPEAPGTAAPKSSGQAGNKRGGYTGFNMFSDLPEETFDSPAVTGVSHAQSSHAPTPVEAQGLISDSLPERERELQSPGTEQASGGPQGPTPQSSEQSPAVEPPAPNAAHPAPSSQIESTPEGGMNNLISDDKSWFEQSNGTLNGSSFAMTALSGMVSLAYDHLQRNQIPLTQERINALAGTFESIVARSMAAYTDNPTLMQGLHTRMRGFLFSYIKANPIPFGADNATWTEWATKAVAHLKAMTNTALYLYQHASIHTLGINSANAAPQPQGVPWGGLLDVPAPRREQGLPASPAADPEQGPQGEASDQTDSETNAA